MKIIAALRIRISLFVICMAVTICCKWAWATATELSPSSSEMSQINVLFPTPTGDDAANRLQSIRDRLDLRTSRYHGVDKSWRRAEALKYESFIFASTSRNRPVSHVRIGTTIPVSRNASSGNCTGGNWHKVAGGGYICTGEDFDLVEDAPFSPSRVTPPAVDQPMPYSYVKVTDPAAYSFRTMPNAEEMERFRQDGIRPSAAFGKLDGVVFYAVDKKVEYDGNAFFHLVNGRYVDARVTEPVVPTRLHGHWVTDTSELPMGFVHKEVIPVFKKEESGELNKVGVAHQYARFSLTETPHEEDDTIFRLTRSSRLLVKESDIRTVDVVPPPPGVSSNDKWLSIRVSQQTLTAYEGTRPVFATLVSTGKVGRSTPYGLDRITRKHVTKTMRGSEDDGGWYYIEEIPWTMYYRRAYAIHGAYWHDVFGNRRSHGCTNLAPVDAFWIYHWLEPTNPTGWHTVRKRGDWVHFTY